MTRRRFLQGSAGGAAGLVVLRSSSSAWNAQANEKLSVVLIGVGGRGTWFVDTMPKMANIVAVCDINQQKIDKAFARWAQDAPSLTQARVKVHHDFRKMFDRVGKEIDAAVVAITDHSHATASAAAMRAGKHVYCEKPLTRLVGESRALRELARKQKVATSMGNQGTAAGPYRRAMELIRDGTIGEIKEVHSWNNNGGADFKEPPKNPAPQVGPLARTLCGSALPSVVAPAVALVARLRNGQSGQLGLAHPESRLQGAEGAFALAGRSAQGAPSARQG
jgi:hypothetical protein